MSDTTAAAAPPQGATMGESQVEQLIEKMAAVVRSSEVDSEAAIVAAIAMQIIRAVQSERDEARAALAAMTQERDEAQESALFFAGALRECLDLAHLRAHKKIERRIRDALGNHV